MSTLSPITDHLVDASSHRALCDNCGHVCRLDDLGPIHDPHERLHAGEEIPAGECPECSALAYLKRDENS